MPYNIIWKVIMFEIKKAGVQHALQSIWEIWMHVCNNLLKAKHWDRNKKKPNGFMVGTEVCWGFQHWVSWVLSCWNSQFICNLVSYQANHNCKDQVMYLENNWDGSRVASKFHTKISLWSRPLPEILKHLSGLLMWCIVGKNHISVPKCHMASGNMEIRIQIIM